MESAAAAMKAVTGKDAKTAMDPSKSAYKATKIHGFTPDAGIFVYCYPNLKRVCSGGTAADYPVIVFSDKGKGDAAKVRDAFLAAFRVMRSIPDVSPTTTYASERL